MVNTEIQIKSSSGEINIWDLSGNVFFSKVMLEEDIKETCRRSSGRSGEPSRCMGPAVARRFDLRQIYWYCLFLSWHFVCLFSRVLGLILALGMPSGSRKRERSLPSSSPNVLQSRYLFMSLSPFNVSESSFF